VPSLAKLQLSPRVQRVLEAHGIKRTSGLTGLNERELLAIRGFGGKGLAELYEALDAAGLELTPDPYAPYVCARHGQASWDTNIADLFLCDACTAKWQRDAFAGQPPEYEGGSLKGFCLNCNVLSKDVRLRQWLLCGTCERVARSIGRSVVAERYVMDRWNDTIARYAPALILESTDEPTLMRREDKASSQKRAEIDFISKTKKTDRNVFGFELKTGKSYISGAAPVGSYMGRFQLDKSDCDDIVAVMEREKLPVYLLHVQVIDRVHPPTQQYLALAGWWTDVFRMASHFEQIRRRPRETRDAAYFDTSMFEPLDTFADHVARGDHRTVARRLKKQGVPALYR
jgi:hypothetical protein